jgi:limonene-1,2-epoxide hydrolase
VRRIAALLALAAVAGCGGGSHVADPADVVLAWSADLNRSHDAAAAALFAPGAEVVQGGAMATLRTAEDAEAFNKSLPCAGHITKLDVRNEFVTATFLLGERPGHACDAPGSTAAAVFRIRRGKIVLWHQVESAPPTPPV